MHEAAAIFEAMPGAIERARDVLTSAAISSTAARWDSAPVAALSAAAERGADVRVLLDGFGEWYSLKRASTLLPRHTVSRFARFPPPRLFPPSFSVNLRNHRKILLVDGVDGVHGRHQHSRPLSGPRTPTHRRLRTTAERARCSRRSRPCSCAIGSSSPGNGTVALSRAAPAGGADAASSRTAPAADLDRLTALLIGAIASARRRVAIMTPYFVPPRELISPLQAAALAGVDVAVILPGAQQPAVRPSGARATCRGSCSSAACNVYYQPPPFVHSKLFYVDDHYAQIGSANFDSRSLRLNFEMNVEVYDATAVTELATHFEAIRERSRRVTLAEADGRPFLTRTIDGVAWLFSPYL